MPIGQISTINPILAIILFTGIGGIIGYITNIIAVKLLFYPENPVKIGPLKIQGVIPARKNDIIMRIINALSSYVTADDFRYLLNHAVDKDVLKKLLKKKISETIKATRLFKILYSMSDILSEELADTLAGKLVEALEPFITETGHELIGEISGNIDIGILVERKTRMFTSKQVEEVFRKIAGKELRFIEYSGLLLGSIIGFIQGLIYMYIL